MGLDLNRFRAKRNDEWLDWLADEPKPGATSGHAPRRADTLPGRPTVHRVGQQPDLPSSQETSKTTAVSINIHVPSANKLRQIAIVPVDWAKRTLPNKKSRLIAAGVTGVFVVSLTGVLVATSRHDNGPKAVLGENSQKPTFAYSLPNGKTNDIDGDVRFDATRKVVNFKDTLAGVEITISQQPLPADFKNDTDAKVKKLAEGFSANKVLATANPTAYLGTSVKGPQTVIFAKKDLLVFIQSTREIDEHDWAEYITGLR